jgi:glutaredoxin-like protein NrdH
MNFEQVPGKDCGKVVLFALSTCGWCKKTKALLSELGIAYDYVFVDLLTGEDRDTAVKLIEKYNPQRSFPTIVLNDSKVIVGFNETAIKEALVK